MEFDLEQIRREWIEGVSGAEFMEKFDSARRRLEAVPGELRCRGVVLCEQDPVEFAAGFFAAVAIRFPVVLANPNWGQQEWREFFELVAPVLGFGVEGAASEASAERESLEAATILIPTGGSTGGVKLAVHDWASLAAACEGVRSFLGGGPIDSCCVLPLYHVSGLMQLLRAYHSGGSVRFDEDDVAGRCLSYVPTQLQRALADPKREVQLAKARAIFVGGAALPEGLADKARELQLPIVPVYGMTETAAMVAAIPAEDFLADAAVGAVALGETRFSIGAEGQICIQSAALFKGYVGREPLDLVEGYWTGDAGSLDADGRLLVLGRMDRLINSGGEKIDPHEVEKAFCRLEGVETALAVGAPDAEWGQMLVVYYTGCRGVDWRAGLKDALAKYKIPKEALWVAALPLDEKGKFNKSIPSRSGRVLRGA
jgi:O-succinylbenzoic acid--CoA ligase